MYIDFPTVKDSEGKEIKITHGNFVPILSGEDRELRKNAFTGLYHTSGALKNTIAATYNANVEQANFYADVRKYPSSRAMYLDGSNIPESVYDNLIKVVHENMDLMYRYVRLRKKSLGVEELHVYDIYAPIAKAPSKKYSFEEAKTIVKEGLAPMGEEYLSKLQEGFDNRWIDVYENEGKRSGAYSWGAYGTHPYVLLNFQELWTMYLLWHTKWDMLCTHIIQMQTRPTLMQVTKSLLAEVASTCNESLLIHDLLKKTKDKETRAYLINHFLEQFKRNIVSSDNVC